MISSQSPPSAKKSTARASGRPARLALKELRETLRDRRTLITLILMPLLVYPLLGVILQKALLTSIAQPEEIRYGIWFCSPEEANRFKELFHKGQAALPKDTPRFEPDLYAPEKPEAECHAEEIIAEGIVDLVVRFRNSAANRSGGQTENADAAPEIELIYRKDNRESQAAALLVQQRLNLVINPENPKLAESRAEFFFPKPEPAKLVLRPIRGIPAQAAKSSLATFVPLMLILMTVTGAVYPAIDLTAGERERGTLEVLVAAPVPRMELLGAKFVAVLTVAMMTAIVNLTAMLITLYASGLESLVFGEGGISWVVIGQILALLMLFAAFFSAVLLAVTSFAKSFKEAQAYLIPLMLVSLAPGVFALTPGLKMNGLIAVAPLVNIVLLGRDLLQGQMVPQLFAVAVISTLLYAWLALVLAARVFGSDAILYGSQGSLKDLFERPDLVRPVPSLTQIAFALAVLFPSFIILGSLPGRLTGVSVEGQMGLRALVTVLLFVGWPVFLVWRNSLRFRSTFRIGRPTSWAIEVAVLWGLSLWIWDYELQILTLTDARRQALDEIFKAIKQQLDQIPLGWLLISLAIVPAVCEEWFFRGYLLSGLRARMSAIEAVLISACLFGIFHVIVMDALSFERFLISGLMGLMLGCLAVRSGSVWPGMLLHALHNGLLLTIQAQQEQIMEWGILMESKQHFPWPWLAGSAAAIGLGVVLLMQFPANELVQSETDAETSKP